MKDGRPRPFTSRTRISLAIARGIAAARGDSDLTASHVALGLLREGENPAVAVLNHAGVPVRLVRARLEEVLGPLGSTRPRDVVVDSTAGEAELVAIAELKAEEWNDPYVGTEHLLLAVLAQEGSPAAGIFAGHGLSADTAVGYLQAVRGGTPPPVQAGS